MLTYCHHCKALSIGNFIFFRKVFVKILWRLHEPLFREHVREADFAALKHINRCGIRLIIGFCNILAAL